MSRRANEAERNAQDEGDLNEYDTPPEALLALMGVEALPECIWEPACGKGNIVQALRQQGRTVIASDIQDRGCPDSFLHDFMTSPIAPRATGEAAAIVTNPPFKLLREGWLEQCLCFTPDVYLLVRLQFLEGQSEWREKVIERLGLRRVYLFRERLPMMHKTQYLIERDVAIRRGDKRVPPLAKSSRMAFAWFCWRRAWTGQTSLRRISWKNPKPPLPPKGASLPKGYCRQTPDMFSGAR
jgi:hypothetical protein